MSIGLIIFTSFLSTVVGIFAFTPISRLIGLTDSPSSIKKHDGIIPLVGGIVIYLVVTATALLALPITNDLLFLLVAAGILVTAGAVDDRFSLNFKFRLFVQCFAGLIVAIGIGDQLHSLGNILGFGEILTGWLSVPITVLAIVGIINAFNMIDGIDGLAAGLALSAFITMLTFSQGEASSSTNIILSIYIGSLAAYLLFNLSLFPKHLPKVFLGDAGSTLLGFSISVFLIRYSQQQKEIFQPTTALWLVAIPLFDMTTTFLRRVKKGKSPFYGDRTHIHHIFLRAGFSKKNSLIIIITASCMLIAVGVISQKMNLPSWLSFLLFLCAFMVYIQFIGHAFKVARYVNKKQALNIILKSNKVLKSKPILKDVHKGEKNNQDLS